MSVVTTLSLGVGAKVNLFAKYAAKFRRAITASNQFFGRCFSCKSLGFAFHSVSVSCSHFVASPFATCSCVFVVAGNAFSFARSGHLGRGFSRFIILAVVVAQAVISAARNNFRAHLLRVGVLHICATSRNTEGAL